MNTEENKIEASPIVNFEDKEYKIEDLSNTSKYFTSQLSDLQIKESKLRFELDQILAAKKVMIDKFRQSLNEEENEKLN
jgi:hypothetical protein|tara:strand:- start:609 stop:845 length:237 start_codon:yes stop_codon:yes gene_type:complete